ncbi:MAG TPA: biotin--[acetyl-CoA-carboxylase] ligase [Paludibacteraceae bacterium]|nr:biotin--[acetyl-CoA-carboxylase] ligase [Paludibacteraceae bacterium]HQB69334.1 biotin--[acetyl-CoA-carboxylase] ligase [Paludibacteraceae bacterium]HRS67590.1 biotin--[acetyl-CoA-carboxylase] ligase [Paludibacteraceae bacterium]
MVIADSEIDHIHLPEVDSTNVWLRNNLAHYRHGFVISTDYQTCGKGQVNTHWESERGANLLFTLLLEPCKIPVEQQFLLSQLISISIVNTLRQELDMPVTIKWPNDIYVGDKKMSGILIENTIMDGKLSKAIVGIGLNVNQQTFTSDAPNPVSMYQLRSKFFDREALLHKLTTKILVDYEQFNLTQSNQLQTTYYELLYRNKGYHLFRTAKEEFEAEINSVLPNGPIQLRTKKGEYKLFAFKEVQFVITSR